MLETGLEEGLEDAKEETGREEGLEALEEEWEEARACECLSHAADPEEIRRLRDGKDHG